MAGIILHQNPCRVSGRVSKLNNHTIIFKNQIPRYYVYNHSSYFFERIKCPPKNLSGLCWFFHETWWFFEIFELFKTSGSLNLNRFQIPRPDGFFIMNFFSKDPKMTVLWFWIFFKYLKLMSIKQKNQNTCPPPPPQIANNTNTYIVLTSIYQSISTNTNQIDENMKTETPKHNK